MCNKFLYNYKIIFSYNGDHFYGSQRQKSTKETVFQALKSNLANVFTDIENLTFSGRTDRGVHAISQVANFNSNIFITKFNFIKNINKSLKGIQLLHISHVPLSFNSMYSAQSREYIYKFTSGDVPCYLQGKLTKVNFNIDTNKLRDCLSLILGKHDFSLFMKSGSSCSSTVRYMYDAYYLRYDYNLLTNSKESLSIIELSFRANGFLYRMIRNIVGCFFEILNPDTRFTVIDLKNSLQNNKRLFNFKLADPHGLYLNEIIY